MTDIELPRDAVGREIPLDTEALYDKSGERLAIYAWEYMPQLKHSKWRMRFLSDYSDCEYHPDEYYLVPPDSWEKLEEDLDKCIETDDSCRYYCASGLCAKCTRPDNDGSGCTTMVFSDIKKRIRKLRGEVDE